jgi:hypothetical protein
MQEFRCARIVEYRERNKNGKWIIFHRPCGRPAAEVTLGGHLTKAKAILCEQHLRQAMLQSNSVSTLEALIGTSITLS